LTSTARWIKYFANHGFNVFTYKTVRSTQTGAYERPNWVFLEGATEPLALGEIDLDPPATVVQGNRDTYLRKLRAFSTANSFGVPSEAPSVWREDVEQALGILDERKLLILSIMGSAAPGDPFDAQRDDFVRVAREALRTEAPAIELNLSCPNTADVSGGGEIAPPLCTNIEATVEVIEAVAEVVAGAVPLVAKLSYLPFDQLEPLVGALDPYVAAVSGINTLPVEVESDGQDTFVGRHTAGLSGVAIRDLGLDFVNSLNRMLNENDHLDFEIIGMGGVMTTEDVDALLVAGASAVQTATAASVNPYLARELSESRSDRRPLDEARLAELRQLLYAPDGSFREAEELAARFGVDEQEVERQINPGGDVDLPRRFFEMIAYIEKADATERRGGEPGPWGEAPSRRATMETDSLDREISHAQAELLLAESVPLAELAERTHSTLSDLETQLGGGSLVSFECKGERRLPAWQLADNGHELLPGLEYLNHAFGSDALAVSQWVLAPNSQLGGRSPRELMQQGEFDRVALALSKLGAAAF
jgi:dihydroorotate dehydrogenase